MIVTKKQPKQNLSQIAYDKIKDALCTGKISQGDILSESQLAADLSMSRTPIREALRTLASEDWLEIKVGIGAYVKPLSSKDMEDLYEIRALLEVQAAKTSIYHITNAEIDELESRFQDILQQYRQGVAPDIDQFSEADWALHDLIVERCENHYIKTIMHNNISNRRRYQRLSIDALNDVEVSTLQHLNILSLLRAKDEEGLAAALREHLVWAASLLHI